MLFPVKGCDGKADEFPTVSIGGDGQQADGSFHLR